MLELECEEGTEEAGFFVAFLFLVSCFLTHHGHFILMIVLGEQVYADDNLAQ